MDSSGISFTALYTGHVWYANQMSEHFFTSPLSHLMYRSFQPIESLAESVAGISIRQTLLQRHVIMDHRLNDLIRNHGVNQVLEIACGLSPRGLHFTRRYPQLRYVEADLPNMVARKRELLTQNVKLSAHHQIVECNFFENGTPAALDTVLQQHFDASQPLVIVTEGLVNYFELPVISAVWSKIAHLTRTFPAAWYLTDVYPEAQGAIAPFVNAGRKTLGKMTRAKTSLHFRSAKEAREGFLAAGFREVTVHKPEQFYDTLPIPRSRRRAQVYVVEAKA
ncbi:predicted O-Methyltransferase involved in polyketide biosynthesis [gamma proteobacterium HdN1]|nr:predicted O-Methyltransferase involved in polyketide biosynthesis [gamma proteobacterium HdN1]